MAANAQPLPWHTEYTADAPRLNSDCRIPRLAPAARPPGGWEVPQEWSTPCRGGRATGTPKPAHSGDGKRAQVRLGRSHGWKTSFGAKRGPCLRRRQVGGGQFAPGAQGAHPMSCDSSQGPAGAMLPTCLPLHCPPAHGRREVPLPYPRGHALPQPHGRAGAPSASSLSRLTSELEDQAERGDPSSNAVSWEPAGYRSERALGRPLPADFY